MDNFIVVVLVGGILMIGFWGISIMNSFVRLSNHVKESWADVDVALKRRHDLIPNLVETVKAYSTHESQVIQRVVEARKMALREVSSVAEHAKDESALGRSVRELLFRVEAYPELKASTNFLSLQEELSNTEDRIAAARRFYNANVRDYNTYIESFPASMFAGGQKRAEFFEIDTEERGVPTTA